MRLLLVNPNTTASMTRDIEANARAVASATTLVEAVNPVDGPASIESDDDEHRCLPNLLAELTKAHARDVGRPDASIIACFGDPGLELARTLVDGPVLGIAQAAMHAAALAAGDFSVVTSMSATVPRAWELAKAYTPSQCLGVYACDIPVLTIDSDPETIGPIGDLCAGALESDGSRAIVLGCAAMAKFAVPLTRRLGVPVVDGVVAATVLAESMVRLINRG
ncbi:aspartate/glutamate racemase family protein [Mycolicibacterium arenosum]|uniref:Aspartate/glutamate racemase family protein n=1 Tax=Mycolicibacterium arenosum TaxID=2952157 RepID=A0ABT1M975_9MYCO|nr:aspartate/glutamate racemase family protein [Mycolicibacterium sp. CAU 1645]MCP9275377.1 aspartate/glutamate racemase family protein [Mycolicibacterium sp. CAU 1645]